MSLDRFVVFLIGMSIGIIIAPQEDPEPCVEEEEAAPPEDLPLYMRVDPEVWSKIESNETRIDDLVHRFNESECFEGVR